MADRGTTPTRSVNRDEEPCFDCGGSGVDVRDYSDCRTCGATGLLYTEEAIRDQIAVEEEHRDDS